MADNVTLIAKQQPAISIEHNGGKFEAACAMRKENGIVWSRLRMKNCNIIGNRVIVGGKEFIIPVHDSTFILKGDVTVTGSISPTCEIRASGEVKVSGKKMYVLKPDESLSPENASGVFSSLLSSGHYENTKLFKSLLDNDSTLPNNPRFTQTTFTVAQNGYSNYLRTLLEAKADVNEQNSFDETALTKALAAGHLNCVEILIDAGASLSTTGFFSKPILEHASKGKCTAEFLALLTRKGIALPQSNDRHSNPDDFSAQTQHPYPSVTAGPGPSGAGAGAGAGVETGAGAAGSNQITAGIGNKRADNNSPRPAILSQYLASRRPLSWRYEDLLKKKNISDEDIKHLIAMIKEENLLNDSSANAFDSVLNQAIKAGQLVIVQTLINMGADVNKNNEHETAMLAAVTAGNIEMVQLLIKEKADINACTTFGVTPLSKALETGRIDLAEILLKNNAQLQINNFFAQPINESAKKGNCEKAFSELLARLKIKLPAVRSRFT